MNKLKKAKPVKSKKMEYILIFITAIYVNNIVLSQFLGICPFLG
ncbi:Rnf-Nqr domain containing protein, partial [Phocaeicola vulgatus]